MTKWFKLAAVTTVFAFGAMMIGCTDDNPLDLDTKIDISLDGISDPIQAGTYTEITGDIESSDPIDSWSWKIITEQGDAVDADVILIEDIISVVGQDEVDLDANPVRIRPTANACDGTYKAVVTVKSGNATLDKSVTFTVTGGSDCNGSTGTTLSEQTIQNVGAQSTSFGSSIDLDAGMTYTSSQLSANAGIIDIVYLSADDGQTQKFFTPKHVQDDPGFTLFNGLTVASISFMKVTSATFSELKTAEQLQDLWDAGTKVTTSLQAGLNDVFIVQTSESDLVAITISEIVSGSGRSAVVNVKSAK